MTRRDAGSIRHRFTRLVVFVGLGSAVVMAATVVLYELTAFGARDEERLPHYGVMAVLVLAALLLLGTLLHRLVDRQILRPLFSLVATTTSLAASTDYRARAPVTTADEFGTLARSFNDMVTVIERRTRTLQESEERLARLAQATFEGIVFTERGNIFEANPQAAEMFGCEPADVIGRSLLDFTAPESHAVLAARIADGFTGSIEAVGRRRDGSTFPVEARVRTLVAGQAARVVALRDMSQVRHAERLLRWSEEKFSKSFLALPIALVIVRADDGIVVESNPAFDRITGTSRGDLAGRSIWLCGFWTAEDEAIVRRMLDGTIEPPASRHLALTDGNGQQRDCLVSGEAVTLQDGPCILLTIVDLTESRRAAEKRAELEAHLQQAVRLEAVGRLAGGVAHDFNNMLTVILGHAEFAMTVSDLPPAVTSNLREIVKAGQQSADLTRQLLTFARRQAVEPKTIDLSAAVASMLQMLRRLIGAQIQLEWRPSTEPAYVFIDPIQVSHVLANLCVNARDAIEHTGTVVLEVSVVDVDVDQATAVSLSPGRFVRLSIRDSGRGIPPEAMNRIFEPFFTTKQPGEGTGLGLATVFGIVHQNQGFVLVDSVPGEGARFRVHLPLREPDVDDGVVDAAASDDLDGRGAVVLLVEDEPGILELGRRVLQEFGYVVLAASSPRHAIELARAFDGTIDLLVTDVVLPGMSGRELAATLTRLRPGLPCMFMSGYEADHVAVRGVLPPGVHLLQKPFRAVDLGVMARRALMSSRRS